DDNSSLATIAVANFDTRDWAVFKMFDDIIHTLTNLYRFHFDTFFERVNLFCFDLLVALVSLHIKKIMLLAQLKDVRPMCALVGHLLRKNFGLFISIAWHVALLKKELFKNNT
ncbi:hypothetical protein ACJX0J_014716, partial [Zea mays]